MPGSPKSGSGLGKQAVIAYAAMALSPNIFMVGVTFMLPQLYAKDLGLNLADLGMALLAIRVFDTVADQAVGYLSDRTRTRFGARKPWVLAGILLNVGACYFLFTPPENAGLAYLIQWRIVYDIGWTMYFVPYSAWGAELSADYSERSRITGYCGIGNSIGVILKNISPIALFWTGVTASSAYSLEMYHKLFWICLPMVAVLTAYSFFRTPQGVAVLTRPRAGGTIRSLKLNRPFRIYLAGFLLANLTLGLNGLLFTYYDSYLNLGAWYPYLMIGYASITTLSIPLWVRIANRIGKHKAFGLSLLASAVALQGFWLVEPTRHSTSGTAMLTACVLAICALSTACLHVAPAAMLADVVDYGAWRSGRALTASYFAFNSIFSKLTVALGTASGFILLQFFGYKVVRSAINSPLAITGLLTTVLLLPGLLNLISCAILWRFPLDARRHAIIRERLAGRAAGELVPPPVSPSLSSKLAVAKA